jgi:BlaI family penicillinase repressor
VETDGLTDLQLAVMKALWQVNEGTVGDILDAMAGAGRALAPTTVATLLQRLRKQGWVQCRKRGRAFLYRAKVGEREAANGALQRLVRSFFGGRASALAAQLVETERLSPDLLAEMRSLVKKREP